MPQQNQRANFLIVFHCDNGSILLSFRDIPRDGERMTDGPTSATNAYLALKAGQQKHIGLDLVKYNK